MAYEQPLYKVGLYPSNDDRSVAVSNQFFGVALGKASGNAVGTGDGNAAIVYPQAGGNIFGVLQNHPYPGEAAELTVKGISKVRATGSFDVDDDLAVDAQGGFVKASGSATVVATAVSQAAPGVIASALLK